jgi:hypothetical protein
MLYDREKKTIKICCRKFDDWVDEFAWAPNSRHDLLHNGQRGRIAVSSQLIDGTDIACLGKRRIPDLPGLAEFSELPRSAVTHG